MTRYRKLALILFAVIVLCLLYIFCIRDWMKPVHGDIDIVRNITYFDEKAAGECPKVLQTVFDQYCIKSEVKDGNECSTTNYDEGFKKTVFLDLNNGYLSITYYFYDRENMDNLLGWPLSTVYVNIFSNAEEVKPEFLGLSDKPYFLDVNSTKALKKYYNSEYGKIRPIFNLISKKGTYGNMKYFISPFCRNKDEYGSTIDPLNAFVDMSFVWNNYTIALHEYTSNYELNFSSSVVLQDVEKILAQAENQEATDDTGDGRLLQNSSKMVVKMV